MPNPHETPSMTTGAATSTIGFCSHGGRLVPMAHWLPRTPFDLDRDLGRMVVGCNQLRCARCDEMVRWLDDADVPPSQTRTASELRDVVDPISEGLLIASPGGRLYVCGCAIRVVFGPEHADGDYGIDPRVTEPGPWRCAGHPRACLPQRFDGVEIGSAADAVRLIGGYLAGTLPPRQPFGTTHEASVEGAWLLRLVAAVADAAFVDALTTALAAQVAAHVDNATTIAVAASVFAALPKSAGGGLVVDAAVDAAVAAAATAATIAAAAAATVDAAPPPAWAELAEPLWLMATVRDDDVGARALEVCRAAIVGRYPVSGCWHAIAARDPQWLMAQATALAAASPSAWLMGPYALRKTLDADAFAALAVACAAAAGIDGDTFSSRLRTSVDAELLERLAAGLDAALA